MARLNQRIIMAGMFLALAALPATQVMAQAATEIAPVNDLADSILGVMTGRLARVVGAIALAAVGYLAMVEKLDKRRAFGICIGIILILGAPTFIVWFDSFV